MCEFGLVVVETTSERMSKNPTETAREQRKVNGGHQTHTDTQTHTFCMPHETTIVAHGLNGSANSQTSKV